MATTAVWYFILVCVGGTCTTGHELSPAKAGGAYDAAFSLASCEEYARTIAQAMFVKDGSKYGYKCKQVDFEPPNLDKQP